MKYSTVVNNHSYLPEVDLNQIYWAELQNQNSKIIVLDDDPTGVQTVYGVPVYTNWRKEDIREGFKDDQRTFFILTNSRAMSTDVTIAVHQEIAHNIVNEANEDFIIVSRSDSTLRGHYPAETQAIYEAFLEYDYCFDGEIIIPFFEEGGRLTIDSVHYVLYNDDLIPAADTEFAKDRTFGYQNSDLKEWIQEKTSDRFLAQDVITITLGELRSYDFIAIERKLNSVQSFNKVVVDAISYDDLKVFAIAYYRSLAKGKKFMFRSAASLVRILAGIPERPLLSKEDMDLHNNLYGGLVVIGSHVKKTTDQLCELMKERSDFTFIEFDQHLVYNLNLLRVETDRVSMLVNQNIKRGRTVVVYTRRDRIDALSDDKNEDLLIATTISNELTRIVSELDVRPAFIVAKGGITSSDIGTKGLNVRKAVVYGQIIPGVPVWLTGTESKFAALPYVIFPGNVGDSHSLIDVVEKLI